MRLFQVHNESLFDPDAFPQCRGAEAETTRFCSIGVSESGTLAPPMVQRDVRIPPSSSTTTTEYRQVRMIARQQWEASHCLCGTFQGCQIRRAVVIDACVIPGVTMRPAREHSVDMMSFGLARKDASPT